MTDNARIRTIATDVNAEMIAEQVHLFYDPANPDGAWASFQARESLVVNGTPQQPMGDFNILQVQMAAIISQKFGTGLTDPVSGADLSQITTAGLMVYIKAAYDQLYNARAEADAAAAAEPEATPEP